ncbi:MAG TPA: cupin domain-containing protein [Pyrinomonadaceae bacterium]|nr:cupin domain-containing protein [Pyrinomonadaceae bacterium]
MATENPLNIRQNFDNPDETRPFEKGRAEIVEVNGLSVMRATFEPGWSWSGCVKPVAGTESCEVSHKWYVVSGRMLMTMNDGTEIEWRPGDVGVVPGGHDAKVIGDEPFIFIDFEGGDIFAKPQS